MSDVRFSARTWRILTYVCYGALITWIALATAGIDPHNSDTVANFIAVTNIKEGGTLYAVAHTNVLKAPLYLLALALYGYSQDAVVFVDAVSTIGFNALMAWCVLVWTRSQARPYLVVLPFLYLAVLSPLFILLTTHPGLRNIDIGASFVWLGLILSDKLKPRYRALAVPLAAILVLNDPWFVTTFAGPAIIAAFLIKVGTEEKPDAARVKLLVPTLAIVGVALGFALRAAIEVTHLVQFVGGETDYRVATADRCQGRNQMSEKRRNEMSAFRRSKRPVHRLAFDHLPPFLFGNLPPVRAPR